MKRGSEGEYVDQNVGDERRKTRLNLTREKIGRKRTMSLSWVEKFRGGGEKRERRYGMN